eukprot:m.664936 g.664936  ORF g.664936 m.664936 type:complete len:318 (-) comp22747_c0_seq16:2769-3722(-)
MLSKILCTPSGEESIFGVQITSDGTTAADNFAALQSFFEKFPEYTTNDFYVAGESYGGFYVPTLSLTIFKAGATFKGSMKGFLVGNGVFDGSITSRARIPFLYGHGAVSTELFTKAQQACGANFSGTSKECDDVANTIETLVQGLNPYDFYRDCYLGPEQATLAQSTRVSMFDIDRSPHTALREMVATLPRPAHPAVVAAMRRTAPTSGSMGYHLGLGETAPCTVCVPVELVWTSVMWLGLCIGHQSCSACVKNNRAATMFCRLRALIARRSVVTFRHTRHVPVWHRQPRWHHVSESTRCEASATRDRVTVQLDHLQ